MPLLRQPHGTLRLLEEASPAHSNHEPHYASAWPPTIQHVQAATPPAEPQAFAFDPLTHITQSTLCRNCGYDLMTRPLDGDCPECGMGVRVAAGLDRLDVLDASAEEHHWLRRLRYASAALFVGTLLTPLTAGLAMPAAYAGMLGLCAPRPGHEQPRRDRQARRATVALLTIGMLGLALSSSPIYAALLKDGYRAFFKDIWAPLDSLLACAMTFFVFGLFPLFLVVQTIARTLDFGSETQRRLAHRLDRATITHRRWWIVVPSLIVFLAIAVHIDRSGAMLFVIPGYLSQSFYFTGGLLMTTLLLLAALWLASVVYAWRVWRVMVRVEALKS